jgi:hypothetical protein
VQASADAAATAEDPVPAHEELEESSQELDDEISLPVSEELEGEPAPVSEAPINEELTKEPFTAPDPAESAADADAKCQARLAAAVARGDDAPVSCVSWNSNASVSGLRAAVGAWPTPDWCDDNGANGKWYLNRFKACGIFAADLNVHDVRTGELLESLTYLVRAYAYSKRDIKTWAFQVELMEVSSWGAAKRSSASGSAKCAGKCKVSESTFPPQMMSASKDAVGQFFLDTTIKASPKGDKGGDRRPRCGGSTRPDGPAPVTTSPSRRLRCGATTPSRVPPRPGA